MRYLASTIVGVLLFATPSHSQEFCVDLCPSGCNLTATDALGVLNAAIGLDPGNCSPPAECPEEWPEPGDACEEGVGECAYGEECCCDECYDSYVCECDGGEFACYFSDACLIPSCSTSTTSTTISTATTAPPTTTTSTTTTTIQPR